MERKKERPITSSNVTKPATRKNQEINIREYDANGYHIIELNVPNNGNYFMMKYNNTHMQIVSRKEIIYDGPGYSEAKKAVESQLHIINRAFTEATYDFDSYLDYLDAEMDKLDSMLDNLDTQYFSYSPRSWDSGRTHSPRRHVTVYQKRSSGCLGCLFWTVIFLVIISMVLYGMGVLGMTIIDFIKSLF